MSEEQVLGASERECPGGSGAGNWASARKVTAAVSRKSSALTLAGGDLHPGHQSWYWNADRQWQEN